MNTEDHDAERMEMWKELMKDAKPFSPLAFYDANRDTITALFADCSVSERRQNDNLTILHRNHGPNKGEIVGVIIHGVKRMVNTPALES